MSFAATAETHATHRGPMDRILNAQAVAGIVGPAARFLGGAALLAGFATLGQWLHDHAMPLPGPVIGLTGLAFGLLALGHLAGKGAFWRSAQHQTLALLRPATRTALRHMGVLFVPAGVGLVTQGDLLSAFWLPTLVGLVGSTLIGAAVTALALHHVTRNRRSGLQHQGTLS